MTKEAQIKEILLACGADVCGVAGAERFCHFPAGYGPADLFPPCRSVIVFGVALSKGLLAVNSRLIYGYANGRLPSRVDDIALAAAKRIEKAFPAVAVPLPCDTPYDDWDAATCTGRGMLSMKHAAVQAGVGALGKSTLLLNPEYGNRLTVGALLTDLALASDPLCRNICLPQCHLCEARCPVGAIAHGHVDQSLCRPYAYGKTGRGFDTVECNRCRALCPVRDGEG